MPYILGVLCPKYPSRASPTCRCCGTISRIGRRTQCGRCLRKWWASSLPATSAPRSLVFSRSSRPSMTCARPPLRAPTPPRQWWPRGVRVRCSRGVAASTRAEKLRTLPRRAFAAARKPALLRAGGPRRKNRAALAAAATAEGVCGCASVTAHRPGALPAGGWPAEGQRSSGDVE